MLDKKNKNQKLFDQLTQFGLSESFVAGAIKKGKPIKIKKRNTLIEAGEICNKGFFILEGGFVSRLIDPKTKEGKTVNFFLADFHPFMSCVDSYFTENKTSLELLAIMDSTIIEFSKKDLDALMAENKDFHLYFNSLIIKALSEETQFKNMLITSSNEEIYEFLIRHCESVIKNTPSKFIAEFMGISPEWLSKTRAKR